MLLEVKKVSVSRVMGTVYFFEEVLKRGVELGEFSGEQALDVRQAESRDG